MTLPDSHRRRIKLRHHWDRPQIPITPCKSTSMLPTPSVLLLAVRAPRGWACCQTPPPYRMPSELTPQLSRQIEHCRIVRSTVTRNGYTSQDDGIVCSNPSRRRSKITRLSKSAPCATSRKKRRAALFASLAHVRPTMHRCKGRHGATLAVSPRAPASEPPRERPLAHHQTRPDSLTRIAQENARQIADAMLLGACAGSGLPPPRRPAETPVPAEGPPYR